MAKETIIPGVPDKLFDNDAPARTTDAEINKGYSAEAVAAFDAFEAELKAEIEARKSRAPKRAP